MERRSEAYQRWRHTRFFPPGGWSGYLSDTKAELALRDAEIADIVLPLDSSRDDRNIVWPVTDLLAELDGLIVRLTEFTPETDGEASVCQGQLDYAKALRAVYSEALQRRTH